LGEDPYLTAQLAVADIQGIQSQGVIATIKHYAANNQEYDRTAVDVLIDERTLHEIYLPAFEAAVQQGQVGAVMCAYNKVNTFYACEQPSLLKEILKQNWGFQGFVMSDWGATHSTVQAANAGLAMQMPDGSYFGASLKSAVNNGQVSIATLNDHVHRILRTMFALGLFDRQPTGSPDNNVATQAHAQFARQVAEQGTVLLKNDQSSLPLDTSKIKTIAVIGADASSATTVVGHGSASVTTPYVVTPLQGIINRAGNGITVNYTDKLDQARQTAKNADVAIVFVNDSESEGSDRNSLSLPNKQDQLVQMVAQANPHTMVVLNTGGPVLMPWVDQVRGIVEAWYPGQEDGNAIAAVLFGDVNPSGKLPMTFPKQASDVPANTAQQYPGINDKVLDSESVFVGYRHYDARKITPLFPFGHGLSYTSFSYSDLSITPNSASPTSTIKVEMDIKNTGSHTGAETAQLYLVQTHER
jgi:beta-glucosidase